jgi:hypothetical protein
MIGCTPEDVVIEQPPDPYFGLSSASCVAEPVAFAHVPGVLPGSLGMDDVNLYVIASAGRDGSGAQSLWRMPKDNSPPQRLATGETAISSLSVSWGPVLYWTTAGDGGATGAVWSIGPDAKDRPVLVASNRSAPFGVIEVIEQDVDLYWIEREVDSSGAFLEVLVRMPTGGPVTRVRTFDADHAPTSIGSFIGVDALFWTTAELGTESTSEVVELPLSASSEPVRITGPDAGGAGAIGLDAYPYGVLYSGPDAITEVPVGFDGGLGTPQKLVATDGFVDDIENDANSVYFVDRSTGQLMAVPRRDADAAPPARILASLLDPATALELDDECVYWIDAATATIMMVAK